MNTTSAHTPGPWHIGKRAESFAVYGPHGEEVACFFGMVMPEEETANARLISAAPELLAALNSLLVQAEIDATAFPKKEQARRNSALSSARAAIAKATT